MPGPTAVDATNVVQAQGKPAITGGFHMVSTQIADFVAKELGLQGEAMYSALNRYANNQTGETSVTPERLALRFGLSAGYVRELIGKLCAIGAVERVTRGDRKVLRVNRNEPDRVVELKKPAKNVVPIRKPDREPELEFEPPTIAAQTDYSCKITPESTTIVADYSCKITPESQRNKEELDYIQNPAIQGGLVVQTSSPQISPPSDRDDFCSSVAAAQTIMLPLGVSGSNWLDTLTGAVDIVIAAKRIRRRDACDFLLSQWALYQSRHGPARKKFFFSDGDFMIEQEAYGSAIELIGAAPTIRINATVAREFNNDFATDEALRILRERRRERDSHDSRASPPVEVGSCD